MCSPIAAIGALASAVFSGMSSKGGGGGEVQSYTPTEQNLTPQPPTEEAMVSMNKSEDATKQAQKGRNSLVINRNPGVGVAGGGGSGVAVPRG